MKNLRKYGKAPFKIAVIHGGPGATGEAAPVAKELSKTCGVLEPLQTAKSVADQIQELKTTLDKNSDLPITLIGHSWGAWLSFMFTAKYPTYVKKLILVSSGPFEQKYVKQIMETRLSRLNDEEKAIMNQIIEKFNDPKTKNIDITKFKKFIAEVGSYDPQFYEEEDQEFEIDIYKKVWPEANEFRNSGKLLELGKQITCPVIAIHGDYDPHPYEGIKTPLLKTIKNFKFILLKNCGHTPWIEKEARGKFYKILKTEIF